MVDPGHGGTDSGATAVLNGVVVREAEINWSVCSVLVSELYHRVGVLPITTRDFGESVSLSSRASQANKARAEVFVSVHCNSFTNPRPSGFEVLHYGSEEGVCLARSVGVQMTPIEQALPYRGIKERPDLVVLRDTEMPACLVELPFMSNPQDLDLLVSMTYQIDVATAIASGVEDFLLEAGS